MMYTYNKEANLDRLTLEISSSSITIALDYISALGTNIDIYFKAPLSASEITTLDGIVSAHVNTPLEAPPALVTLSEKKTSTGITKVSAVEAEGDATTLVSHNFCDKTSWLDGSVEVVDDTLTNTSGNSFASSNGKTHWIDLKHGKLYGEDAFVASHPVIKIDGVVKAERLMNYTTNTIEGDYDIDYATGVVTFTSPVITGTVTASYRYADKSYFRVTPAAGKILSIKAAEVQFAKDTVLPAPFYFEVWWNNHPTYGTNPVPTTKIAYKNFKDFISACNEGQGMIPAIGDITQDIHVFPFNYARPKALKSSYYYEVRVYTANHQPCGGQFATASFYILSEPEE